MKNEKRKTNILLFTGMIFSLLVFLLIAISSFAVASVGNQAFVVVGFLAAFAFFILFGIYVGYYNKIIRYKNKVAESLSLIDVYLKKRFDLVPNLVETVKGYMKYEKELLTQVTELRNSYSTSTNEEEKINLSNSLAKSMKKVLVTVEEYPALKADKLFKNFMFELSDVEDEIAASRRFYNSNVNAYNSLIEIFPGNMVAKTFGFVNQKMFKIDANQRIIGKIKFN